jgi:hypothetical protein
VGGAGGSQGWEERVEAGVGQSGLRGSVLVGGVGGRGRKGGKKG